MRRHAIAACLLGLMAVPVSAEEPGAGRYAIQPSVDGFIRLDTETGAMAHCTRRDGVWRCETLAEEKGAIAALDATVRALGARLDDIVGRLAALEAGKPAVEAEPPETVTGIEPAPGFAELLVGRLFQLVRDIRAERQPNS